MKVVLKYFKPHLLVIAAVIAFLAVRAQGELALPDYMSDIVDVGISQSGVGHILPEAAREETITMLAGYMEGDIKETFLSAYSLTDKLTPNADKLSEKYPLMKETPIYILEADAETVKSLEGAVMSAAVKMMAAVSGTDLSAMEGLPESILISQAETFVKSEYEALGMDTGKYQLNYILQSGGKMLLVLLMIMGCILAETFLSSRMAAGVSRVLRRDVFAKVTGFSNAEFDKFSTASLITRSTNDIQQIQLISFLFLRFVVYSPMLGVGAVFKVLNSGSGMTWTIAVSVLATLVLVVIIFSLVIPKFKVMQKFVDKLNLVSRESLTGVMVVRAFNKESIEEQKFDAANKDLRGLGLFVMRVFSFMNPFMMMILNGVTLLIIWVGAGLIDQGNLQVGSMMAFLQYAMQIINSFMMLTMIAINLPRALVSVNRVAEVLSEKSAITDPSDGEKTAFSAKNKGFVEFKNVSFKYPGADDYVLRDLSFMSEPGKTTAFIGSTGSGKTTAVNLIPRFYDVTEGQILIDGADVRKVSIKELRKKIGYVPQKALLFSGSIASNIKFGETDGIVITDGYMEEAAKIAQAYEFISEKPYKYEEPISQAGVNVSGGQKQRLSIARAIAKKPEVFIFDDSFSALDYKTDAALRRAISDKLGTATVLVVAQRIGTIKNADQIIVLDEGRIVGKGKHNDLLKNCDVYKQIALSQLSEKELGIETDRGAV